MILCLEDMHQVCIQDVGNATSFQFVRQRKKIVYVFFLGLAVLDNWLYLCGGLPLNWPNPGDGCSKFDLDGADVNWQGKDA